MSGLQEAVQWMKEGNLVEWIITDHNKLKPGEKNPIIGFDPNKTQSGFYDIYENDAQDVILSALLKGSSYWEVFNEIWNLKDIIDETSKTSSVLSKNFIKESIKEFRDNFFQDIENSELSNEQLVTIQDLFNIRLGDI